MMIASNSPSQNAPTCFWFLPEGMINVFHNVMPFEVTYDKPDKKEDVAIVLIMRNPEEYKKDDFYYDRQIFSEFQELHPEFEIKFINQLGGRYNEASNG